MFEFNWYSNQGSILIDISTHFDTIITGSSEILASIVININNNKVVFDNSMVIVLDLVQNFYLSFKKTPNLSKIKGLKQFNLLSSDNSSIFFKLNLNTKTLIINFWLLLKVLNSGGIV